MGSIAFEASITSDILSTHRVHVHIYNWKVIKAHGGCMYTGE